jgi:hypothetical protein
MRRRRLAGRDARAGPSRRLVCDARRRPGFGPRVPDHGAPDQLHREGDSRARGDRPIGCATPTRATRSTAARRSRQSRRRSAMPILRPRASMPTPSRTTARAAISRGRDVAAPHGFAVIGGDRRYCQWNRVASATLYPPRRQSASDLETLAFSSAAAADSIRCILTIAPDCVPICALARRPGCPPTSWFGCLGGDRE